LSDRLHRQIRLKIYDSPQLFCLNPKLLIKIIRHTFSKLIMLNKLFYNVFLKTCFACICEFFILVTSCYMLKKLYFRRITTSTLSLVTSGSHKNY
jgi:hypothetical protein